MVLTLNQTSRDTNEIMCLAFKSYHIVIKENNEMKPRSLLYINAHI